MRYVLPDGRQGCVRDLGFIPLSFLRLPEKVFIFVYWGKPPGSFEVVNGAGRCAEIYLWAICIFAHFASPVGYVGHSLLVGVHNKLCKLFFVPYKITLAIGLSLLYILNNGRCVLTLTLSVLLCD